MCKHKTLIRILSGWILAGTLILAITYLVQAAPLLQTTADGEAIFNQKCAACHTIGGGKLVGPDLQGVTTRRDIAWIKEFISAPDKVLASGDPIATQLLAENNNVAMPNLGITQTEVDALVAFFESGGTAAAAPAAPAAVGDPQRGKSLFMGKMTLLNGGPNCIACHSTADVTSLGGGTLGPELTNVLQRYGGEPGLASALAGLPFPTMQGVFVNKPLDVQEQADLLAYFIQVNQKVPAKANLVYGFWIGGGIGALVFFALMAIFWPRQRQSLSDRLRKQA
jgi:mono/diheme cytochrome c family protein